MPQLPPIPQMISRMLQQSTDDDDDDDDNDDFSALFKVLEQTQEHVGQGQTRI